MDNLVQIMDETTVMRSLLRMTHEIIEHDDGARNIAIVGIKNKGIELARILKENLRVFTGCDVPFGELDVTQFRDDISLDERKSANNTTKLPFNINDLTVILVDDVLFTGRTARAAIEALFTYGRPNKVQLAVLIDRGHRELPIRPDYVGKNVPSSKSERIRVKMNNVDGETGVFISRS